MAGWSGRSSGSSWTSSPTSCEQRQAGRRVVGYGAPGKANTLLNHCGIKADLIEYLVDRNPYKHGRFTPGARIPIHPPERLLEDRPDVIVILPWNLRDGDHGAADGDAAVGPGRRRPDPAPGGHHPAPSRHGMTIVP